MSDPMYEIAVIGGGGMIGAAAARHLVEAGRRIVVVAAPEPDDWSSGTGPFASHYDAARITRVMAADPVWAELAHRSIARYADLERRSGVTFHRPCGLAWIGPDLEDVITNATDRGADARRVSRDWLYAVTGIRVPDIGTPEAALEAGPAGTVDPRALPRAELVVARNGGAEIVPHAARSLRREGNGFVVAGSFGEVRAASVLLATGSYGAGLAGVELALVRNPRTVLRVDLGPATELPALIIDTDIHEDVTGVYWTPPSRYPDGRTLFKIGGSLVGAAPAESPAEIDAWFATDGSEREAAGLMHNVRELLPGARLFGWDTKPCVTTDTATGYPYLGFVDDGIAVALGGNGASAKSCDEIGRLASRLFTDAGWTDEVLSAETFTPQFA